MSLGTWKFESSLAYQAKNRPSGRFFVIMRRMKKPITIHSSGGVVLYDNEILLIKWKNKDSIEFPKGTIELGESSEAACTREVYEETGYSTQIIGSLGSTTFEYVDSRDSKNYRKTVDYYLLNLIDVAVDPTPHRERGEDFNNLWVGLTDAEIILTFDDTREVLARAIKYRV